MAPTSEETRINMTRPLTAPLRASVGVVSRCMGASVGLFKGDSGKRNASCAGRLPGGRVLRFALRASVRNRANRVALSRRIPLSRTLEGGGHALLGIDVSSDRAR